MDQFNTILERAAQRKGGTEALEALMPQPKSPSALSEIGDDRYLAGMTKGVFQAGFVWRVVENKWPDFEAVFEGFNPRRVASMNDEELEGLMNDPRIIRHWQKLKATRENATFVVDLATRHGSAARFFADWPTDDIVGLFDVLKRQGSRLGGMTGQYYLRSMGKDTFIITKDVSAALVAQGVVDKSPSSKRDLAAVQDAFNAWHAESGRPYSHISRVLAFSVGD